MNDQNNLLYWLLGSIAGILILYFIIKLAVASAMAEHNKNSRDRTRLLIKKMLKEGFSRHEIVEALQDDEATFWNRIK